MKFKLKKKANKQIREVTQWSDTHVPGGVEQHDETPKQSTELEDVCVNIHVIVFVALHDSVAA